MRIKVTIPKGEQFKLPSERDIFIIMTAHWTNEKYLDEIDATALTFQNLLQKVRFSSDEQILVPYLNIDENPVAGASPLVLNAADSFVSNVLFEEARLNLTYSWSCDKIFDKYCLNYTSPVINVPWLEIYNLPNMTWEKYYTFEVTINWDMGNGTTVTKKVKKDVLWLNVTMPQFSVEMKAV